ncbi:S-M checkpoint control protein rad4 [Tolypocladium capitatum]|uniref:S-M checkpoint control protein rad4 n=1 Tax=Tolypocladium capitatum TaxID=45235 RepID=A0A2K3Q9E2_9HYPO|nr:S-M checkpoint control protein rad4 [Tolypocladium capitatum]
MPRQALHVPGYTGPDDHTASLCRHGTGRLLSAPPPASAVANMASPASGDDEQLSIDPAAPFRGVVVCCTSIPPDQRSDINNKVAELGGVHKYDLTPDVTHLVVGDYDTPKYRHVARERADIKAMDAAWIEAVSRKWRNDQEIDFWGLERRHQLKPLEKCGQEAVSPGDQPAARKPLRICLTGFGDQRDEIAEKITSNGGEYTGDLTRRCSHLIVSNPEGKKFQAAKSWGVYTVTLAWLDQTIARGMILEEAKFDPLLPADTQGVGAWVRKDPKRTSLGKRSRPATTNGSEEGTRKLRKTASMKLNSQRNNLWGDILGRSTSREYSFAQEQPAEEPTQDAPCRRYQPAKQLEDEGVFSNCVFAIHGFDQRRHKVLDETIATLSGLVARSPDAISAPALGESFRRFLVVPQTSRPDTHPHVPSDSVHIVTELYIERCLQNKRFADPGEHILGRPFPLFPIPGFSELTICSAAFTGLELTQVARSVTQLGARFEEQFRRTTSLVVCKSLEAMRKEKLRYALEWNVPVVAADWLWECISAGFNVPVANFVFPELREQYVANMQPGPVEKRQPGKPSQPKPTVCMTTIPARLGSSRPRAGAGVDSTGFDRDSPERTGSKKSGQAGPREDSNTSADFMTARTQPADALAKDSDAPLSELSFASVNKSPSPPKRTTAPARTRSEPSAKPVVDKPTVPSRGPSAPPPDASKDASKAEAEQDARAADEEARKQAKAAERQVLSSKLTSLIQSATDPDGPESRTQAPPPRPRRRRILGRAVSNVSNASSAASVDGSGTRLRAAVAGGEYDEPMAGDAQPPPGTQLDYRNPQENLDCKAALVKRMMGGSGEAKTASAASSAAAPASSSSVGAAGGRALRKR